ncbi:MAG: hypothetical protein AAGD43_21455, partial [Pseudomonadota bacterium]
MTLICPRSNANNRLSGGLFGLAVVAGPSATITGTPQIGEILTGVINGLEGGEVVSNRKWTRNGADIAGASATTYTLVALDDEQQIRFQTDVDGQTIVSAPVAPIYPIAVNTDLPELLGTPQPGEILTVDFGAWTGAVGGAFTVSVRSDGVEFSNSTSFTVPNNVGEDLTAVVTYANSGGSPFAQSAPVEIVAAPPAETISVLSVDGQTPDGDLSISYTISGTSGVSWGIGTGAA